MLCGHAGRMLAPLCGLQRDDLQQRRQTVEIGHVTGGEPPMGGHRLPAGGRGSKVVTRPCHLVYGVVLRDRAPGGAPLSRGALRHR